MRRRSGYGWFELIIGILLVIFGVYTLIHPSKTLTWIGDRRKFCVIDKV